MIYLWLVFIIWLVFFSLSYISYLLYLTHMFQLNSYKSSEQFRWMKKNTHALLLRSILPAAAVSALLILKNAALIYGMTASGILWIVNFLAFRKRKEAKKPFVYTSRVIRMLVTQFLAAAAAVGGAVGIGKLAYWIPAVILYLCLPLLVILVNVINIPVQKMINRKYMNEAKRKISDMPNLIVIGITGSYGKTSVKFFLTKLLSGKFNVLCTPSNYNTDLGVTKTIREDLLATHEVFVCEMGARYCKDIKNICDIVHPEYGVITSIGPQHLETFGSIGNIIKTKFELYESIPDSGKMFLNYDNEYIKSYTESPIRKTQIGFGKDPDSKFRLESMKMTAKGSRFTVCIDQSERIEFVTDLIGEHNILDIVAAIAVAYSLGITATELMKQVKLLKPVPHRLQLLQRQEKVTVIDDAYNSNPIGFRSALDTLTFFEEKKVLVTPGMIELGEKEYKLNYEMGSHASEICDFIILVGRKQTKPLYDGVCSNPQFDSKKLVVVDSLEEVWDTIAGLTTDNMVVLFENDLPDNY